MLIRAESFPRLHQPQRCVRCIKMHLPVALREQKENAARRCDDCALCRPCKCAQGIGQERRIRGNNGRQDRCRIRIRVPHRRMNRAPAQQFQCDEVIHCRLAEEHILLDRDRHLVPLRLFAVTQRPAIAQPVKKHNRQYEYTCIHCVLPRPIRQCRIRKRRQCQKSISCGIAECQIGQIAQQQPRAVILMKENIRQISLVRVASKQENRIERIVKM